MDEPEIEALYRQHIGAARALGVLLTGNVDLADDLAQDVFIRCIRRLSDLRDPASFRAYWQRGIVNATASYYRRTATEVRALMRTSARPQADADASLMLSAPLVHAMRQLPARQRTAVAARYILDWSEKQTAEAMGCRVGTVKSLSSRGLSTLRETLIEEAANR